MATIIVISIGATVLLVCVCCQLKSELDSANNERNAVIAERDDLHRQLDVSIAKSDEYRRCLEVAEKKLRAVLDAAK